MIVSKVSCSPASLLAVRRMTSSPRGERQWDCIFWSGNTHWQTHKRAASCTQKQTPNVALFECTSTGVYQHAHPSSTHSRAFTKPQVYDRWRRLIASALHHEWQQEVMNALLYGGRGNGHVGYLSLRLWSHFPSLICTAFPFPSCSSCYSVTWQHISLLAFWSLFRPPPPLFLPSHDVLLSVLSGLCIWDL